MKRDRTDWSDTLPVADQTHSETKARDRPAPRQHMRVLRPVLWILAAALAAFQFSRIAR